MLPSDSWTVVFHYPG